MCPMVLFTLQFPLWRQERSCLRRWPGHTHEQITLQALSHDTRTYIDYFKSGPKVNRIVKRRGRCHMAPAWPSKKPSVLNVRRRPGHTHVQLTEQALQ